MVDLFFLFVAGIASVTVVKAIQAVKMCAVMYLPNTLCHQLCKLQISWWSKNRSHFKLQITHLYIGRKSLYIIYCTRTNVFFTKLTPRPYVYHSSYLPVLKPKGKGIETSWSRGIARELSVGKTQAMLLSLGGNPPDHKAYIHVGEDLRDPT